MSNPHPTDKFKPLYGDEALAKKSFSVRLPKDLDNYLRSLPNKTEWLREAAIEKWQREQTEAGNSEL